MNYRYGVRHLVDSLARSRRVFVLTGAGISTESGIPDYRDEEGNWKREPPPDYRDFVRDAEVRRRYWERARRGWPKLLAAQPNVGHRAIATLEELGRMEILVTQNVDGLHQRAGSENVLDLHGRIGEVICLDCRAKASPFETEDCPACGGILKPDVVFYGETVPAERVERAKAHLANADLLLVAGSSLKVWSGYRFARAAHAAGTPIAIVNLGKTRADEMADVVVNGPCGEVLAEAVGLTLS